MVDSGETKTKTKSDILLEFFEVAFHAILYYREIYPKTIFTMKKKYQVPIHVSIHPGVNDYIKECLTTLQKLLEWDGVQQVALVILSNDVVVEKFCFDLSKTTSSDTDEYFIRVEESFRQYLLKLSVADFKELPDDCTFRIQVITKEDCSVRLSDSLEQAHFPWIEADEKFDCNRGFRILPMKTLDTDFMSLNMYVEK